MSTQGETNLNSLPTLSGSGIVDVSDIITYINSFEPDPSSSTYTNLVQDPANLVGTSNVPYQPVALPSYIATLYSNVYNINTSLINSFSSDISNNRQYPTAYAVANFVEQQLSSQQQIITATTDSSELDVNVTSISTIIYGVNAAALQYTTPTGNNVYVYNIDTDADTSVETLRDGATKDIMFIDPSGVLSDGDLVYLYCGVSGEFYNAGNSYDYYQFTFDGSQLSLTCKLNSPNNTWDFYVRSYNSIFSDGSNNQPDADFVPV